MVRVLFLFSVLCGFWFVFSGYDEPFFIISGIISCLIAVLLSFVLYKEPDRFSPYINVRGIVYGFWLLREMFRSALDVSKRVWQVEPDISPSLTWISCSQDDDVGKAIYGTSITLTPGTVCVDIENDLMLIHSLTKEGASSLMEQEMDTRVTGIKRKNI